LATTIQKKKNGNKLEMARKEINITDGDESHYWWRYGVSLKLVKKDKIFKNDTLGGVMGSQLSEGDKDAVGNPSLCSL
jgi:hypothetical protein